MQAIRLEPMLPTGQASSAVASDILRQAPNSQCVAELLHSVIEGQLALYDRTQAVAPWIGYLAHDVQTGELVGSCSFIGNGANGSAEIAYFTFPQFEGAGVATAMARELLAVAARAGNPDLHAFTLPEENASTRILEKLGFTCTGEGHDEDAGVVWRWDRPRQRSHQ
jgi:RimJ/RimL family protein N-acetyltransferase